MNNWTKIYHPLLKKYILLDSTIGREVLLKYNQNAGGVCSLCGSTGVNKSTCPLNKNSKNVQALKHPKSNVLKIKKK